MGSILVSDFGGKHHFHNAMFGGGSTAHQQTQEAPAVHHTPVRPSPGPPANGAPQLDVTMPDSSAPPSSTTSVEHHHAPKSAPGIAPAPTPTPASAPSPALPPSSPRPHHSAQQSTPAASHPRQVPVSAGPQTQPAPAQSLSQSTDATSPSPRRIKVKSLSHIQSFAIDDASPFSQTRSLSRRQQRDPADVGPSYEISEMPVSDIIEMVAGLLTKITTTNDRQHDHLHRQIPPPEGTAGLSQQTTSVLAFHGKNVPSISILSYLSRIHKYCPTTYEVFLSLLVYFDRMTERVNAGPMSSLRKANQQSLDLNDSNSHANERASPSATLPATSAAAQAATPPPSGSLGKPRDPAVQTSHPPSPLQDGFDTEAYNLSHFFVVDSFNIHRLVIAGVTCASKFFSDVFYTNSRYAKVGGLPLVELNHLELQFLLLNDFRLAVPLEEMEAYGTMLVEFYAREVAEQHERRIGDRN